MGEDRRIGRRLYVRFGYVARCKSNSHLRKHKPSVSINQLPIGLKRPPANKTHWDKAITNIISVFIAADSDHAPVWRTQFLNIILHFFSPVVLKTNWTMTDINNIPHLHHLQNNDFPESPSLTRCSPKGPDSSLHGRGGGVEVGASTSTPIWWVRLLQITHDTSSDDIFQPFRCWMASVEWHLQRPTSIRPPPTHTLIPTPPSLHPFMSQ